MQDISVVYISKSILLPGMGTVQHVHDYWHFSMQYGGVFDSPYLPVDAPICACTPPGVPHGGGICREKMTNINVMFFVHDKALHNRLRSFPFEQLKEEDAFLPVLLNCVEQTSTLSLSQEYLNTAIASYFYLLLDYNHKKFHANSGSAALAEKCVKYIEENYMNPIKLDDIANHLGRTGTHAAHTIKAATGLTSVEHLNSIRIKNACAQLAYSSTPLEEVASACGFQDVKYFCRVFKNITGTTPSRYRTSHVVNDMCYNGHLQDLNVPYEESAYTYIPCARKCINWKTPLEYISQSEQKAHRSN